MIEDFAWQFPFDELTIYIESDLKTCYAYAGQQDGEVYNFYGDTWLFNCGGPEGPPVAAEASLKPPMPNPAACSRTFDLGEDIAHQDFEVRPRAMSDRWIYGVFFRRELIGVLWDGSVPGYSRFAILDSPVARVMPEDLSAGW